MQAIDEAHVVLLVDDAFEGFLDQEARLVSWAMDQLKPTLVVVNKWDLVVEKDAKTAAQYKEAILHKIRVHVRFLWSLCRAHRIAACLLSSTMSPS